MPIPRLPAALDERLVKVKTGGRSGHRAVAAGVHGLVALPIQVLIGAVDVGWQRHVADVMQDVHQSGATDQTQRKQVPLAAEHLQASGHLGRTGVGAQPYGGSGSGWLAGTDQGQTLGLPGNPLDEHFQFPPAGLLSPQARRNHPAVVEHQQIFGSQYFQQIGEAAMADFSPGRVEAQQAAGGALRQWVTGNEFVGKRVLEVGKIHQLVRKTIISFRPKILQYVKEKPPSM